MRGGILTRQVLTMQKFANAKVHAKVHRKIITSDNDVMGGDSERTRPPTTTVGLAAALSAVRQFVEEGGALGELGAIIVVVIPGPKPRGV